MGIYRRKGKDGKPYGPFIVQYPYMVDPATKKTRHTAISAGFSRKRARSLFAEKMLEWEEKKRLGIESKRDYSFKKLVDWFEELPVVQKLKTANKVLQHCRTLKAHFGNVQAREIMPYMIEEYLQQRRCQTTCRGTPYKPASINREFEVLKRIFNLAIREGLVDKTPVSRSQNSPSKTSGTGSSAMKIFSG